VTVIVNGLKFDTEDEAADYWAAVKTKDLAARAKGRALPKCRECKQAMWLNQKQWNQGTHRVCADHQSEREDDGHHRTPEKDPRGRPDTDGHPSPDQHRPSSPQEAGQVPFDVT
jgi:hypothetical protein